MKDLAITGSASTISDQRSVHSFISIVVPVRNEERFIARTIDDLVVQDYPPSRYEILVVDGESDDRTREIAQSYVEKHNNVRLFTNPKRWSSAARNIGVREARGDVILVVDGHCELTNRDYLKYVASAFVDPRVDCIGRPQPLDVSGATTLRRAIAAARSSWLGHHPDSFIYSVKEQFVPASSVGVAYRRQVFDTVGMFDEAFDACEDVEFNHRVDRAGLCCLLAPKVALPYHPRSSLQSLFLQLVRYGRGRVRLLRKHPDTIRLGTFVPGLLVLGLLMTPATILVSQALFFFSLAVVALYLVILLTVSMTVALGRREFELLIYMPLVFVTIHIGAGCGVLRELLDITSFRRKL